MAICLLGIFSHVVRKATHSSDVKEATRESLNTALSEESSEDDYFESSGRNRSNYVDTSSITRVDDMLPLLNDTDDDDCESEIEMNRKQNGRNKSRSVSSDDFFLRDNRTWTSVRDRHLEMRGLESEDDFLQPQRIIDHDDD
jgi:hypothetical protein